MLGAESYRCLYVKKLSLTLSEVEQKAFLEKLWTWDKQFYLKLTDQNLDANLEIPVEKYLLVQYADEHLELPPLNNRL